MTGRTLANALRWMKDGTTVFLDAVEPDDAWLSAASRLPGWTRRHVIAHVAANADAVGNLVHWARTGIPTPMYPSPEARAAGIEQGARRPTADLITWLHRSAAHLASAIDGLTDEQWQRTVVTGQGRSVAATEIPWLRSREVYVHAVDLAAAVAFTDLPRDFLLALCHDVVAKRVSTAGPAVVLTATDVPARWSLGTDEPVSVSGSLAAIAAYLTGRDHDLTTADGAPAPALPPWL